MLSVLERPTTTDSETSQFVIETNIPLPPRFYGAGRTTIYPFAHMRPGDSFEVPLSKYTPRTGQPTLGRLQSAIGNSARTYATRHGTGAKFATRTVGDKSVRIWRTA